MLTPIVVLWAIFGRLFIRREKRTTVLLSSCFVLLAPQFVRILCLRIVGNSCSDNTSTRRTTSPPKEQVNQNGGLPLSRHCGHLSKGRIKHHEKTHRPCTPYRNAVSCNNYKCR